MNMNNKEYNELDEMTMAEIKRKTEEIEIPEKLSAENMMKYIKEKNIEENYMNTSKSENKIIKYIFGAASIAVCASIAFAATIVFNGKLFNNEKNTEKKNQVINNKQEKIMAGEFDSYEALAKVLKDSTDKRYNDINYEEEIYDEINTDNAEVSKGDGNGSVTNDMVGVGDEESQENFSGTNIQVEGIDEADVVKSDGEYFYIGSWKDNGTSDKNCLTVKIFDIKSDKVISNIDIDDIYCYSDINLYIYKDKLCVIYTDYDGSYNDRNYEDNYYEDSYAYDVYVFRNINTHIDIYDISDREKPILAETHEFSGNYDSSRLKEGIVYLTTNYYVNDTVTENNCVPSCDEELVPIESVVSCGEIVEPNYMTVSAIELKENDNICKVIDSRTIIIENSYGYMYMSDNNIYFSKYDYEDTTNEIFGLGYYKECTDIIKIPYVDGVFGERKNCKLDGGIYGQFAMDEYQGYLRVVTTENVYNMNGLKESNSVYVLDSELNIVGELHGIAEGESIYSARFKGDIGYMVTYFQTDPLFKIDFSDVANPKLVGSLEIPGFSKYLHFWSDNLLFGIGYEEGVKISMYDGTDSENLIEVSKIDNVGDISEAVYDHKALFIQPEKNLVGFCVCNCNFSENDNEIEKEYYCYKIFKYENDKFNEFINYKMINLDDYKDYDEYWNEVEKVQQSRAMYVNDIIYIIVPGKCIAEYNIFDGSMIKEINLA